MFSELNSFLNITCQSFIKSLICVTGSGSDSSFIIHHFLSYLLKNQHKVALLSLSQSFTHYNGVGNKIGNNLNAAKDEQRFLFIEGLKILGSSVNGSAQSTELSWCKSTSGALCVRKVFCDIKARIEKVFEENKQPTVLIVDDVNVLVDTGLSVVDVCHLIQQLNQYLSTTYNGCLIVNNCLVEDDEDAVLLKKYIEHQATISIEVRGLDTGFCKDVHGQIAVTWRNTASREKWPVRSSQFKLTDKCCILFASGMSSAVL